ncbi:MAG TPA: TolC family protein [Phycisphaerales bacterium]|nr:TolC family protein [Phycisphaerales bacterium]
MNQRSLQVELGLGIPVAGALIALAGCTGPIVERDSQILTRSVIDAVRREMVEPEQAPEYQITRREDSGRNLGIPEARMAKLNEMGGMASYDRGDFPMDDDLLGGEQRMVTVSLERVIRSAATHNLQLQFDRLRPAISESQLVEAEAAFDWTFFTNGRFQSIDRPRTSSTFFGTAADVFEQNDVTVGIRRRLTSGGSFTLDSSWTWNENSTPGLTVVPNPANTVTVGAQLTQPLLRNAGSDVTLASVRLATNADRDATAQLKASVINTLQRTEEAYWQLVLAHQTMLIQQRLLERGIGVRDIIIDRGRLDATQAQIADARAEVESRRAQLIRAQRSFRQASDSLKVLINDPELTIGSEVLLLPSDDALDEPIRFSLVDAVTTALTERPEIDRALLSIDDTSIRKQVARNQLRPRLDLELSTRWAALNTDADDAYGDVWEGRFIDYIVGLTFEQPIGNRLANAQLRRRQLEGVQAVASFQNTVQQVVLEVKNAMRDVVTGYKLIAQTRTSRLAATENLRALRVQIESNGGYTAFNLDQWLSRQQALASAEIQEAQALTNYNIAISRMYSAIGRTLERNGVDFVVPETNDE